MVHFNRFRPGPAEATPPPEVVLLTPTPGDEADPVDAFPDGLGGGGHNEVSNFQFYQLGQRRDCLFLSVTSYLDSIQ